VTIQIVSLIAYKTNSMLTALIRLFVSAWWNAPATVKSVIFWPELFSMFKKTRLRSPLTTSARRERDVTRRHIRRTAKDDALTAKRIVLGERRNNRDLRFSYIFVLNYISEEVRKHN